MPNKQVQITIDLYEADIINIALQEYYKDEIADVDDIKIRDQWAEMVEALAQHNCPEDA